MEDKDDVVTTYHRDGSTSQHRVPKPRISVMDANVLQVEIVPVPEYHRSAFSHPLVAIDYGRIEQDGERREVVAAITFVGPVAKLVLGAGRPRLIEQIKGALGSRPLPEAAYDTEHLQAAYEAGYRDAMRAVLETLGRAA